MHQKTKSSKKGDRNKTAVRKTAAKKASIKKEPAKKNTVKKSALSAGKPAISIYNMNFPVEGINCAARLYLPEGAKKPPVIIMGNGIGLEMGFGLPLFADEFAKNGYAVFLFDYRYYGESEGEPRHLLFPGRQLKDWSAAVKFVRKLDKVDSERICIWGYSFSGGHVLATAACNSKVKAFMAHMPYMDSLFILKINGFKKSLKISLAGYKDLFYSVTGKGHVNIQIAGRPDDFAIMTTPETYDGYLSLIPEGSEWKNEMPARSMLAACFFRPFKFIPNIKCRGLVICGENDSITDNKMVERYFKGNEQFEFIKLKCGHFGIFKGEYFKEAVSAELLFLKSVFS